MYAIIREGDGKFYTSMVFGYYKSSDDSDYKNRFWVVLNKAKTALVKQHVLQQNTKYLIPMVLITDADAMAIQSTAINAADGFKTQETILANVGNDKANLVHMGIELDNFICFFFTH